MTDVGGRGKGKPEERERSAVADLQEQMRREAEAHFRWAREAKLRREAENRGTIAAGSPAPMPPQTPADAQPSPGQERSPAAEAPPTATAPSTETAPPPESSPVVEATPARTARSVAEAPSLSLRGAALAGLQPTFEDQWQQLERNRRDLLAEWARLSKARERIEATYERLDALREQLDAERRQLELQRERLWMGRFQLVSESERSEARPVATDRWRDAASHVLEAAVIVRATVTAVVAEQGPRWMARLRGRAARGALTGGRRRALPPGS